MHKIINGWTKESMKAAIKKYNKGYPSRTQIMKSCLYLNPEDGNRCAVGCFIPDDSDALQSFLGAHDVLIIYPELKDIMPLSSVGLRFFQAIHDRYEPETGSLSLHEELFDFIDNKCTE